MNNIQRFVKHASLSLIAVLASTASATAQCREWADGFGITGTNGIVRALAVFDDGSGPALFAAGEFTQAGVATARGVARWDGSAWSLLGAGLGGSLPNAHALAVFDDGSGPALYVGGSFTSAGLASANRIAKWD